MDHLVEAVNRLQDAFARLGRQAAAVDLPQIAVVGSQSSGKSSVLENIVGRDFLPRGSGIVTRRPLVLQLTYQPEGKNNDPKAQSLPDGQSKDMYGEFLHKPDTKFYDFNALRNEIVAETERVTGKNVGISPAPINLRIYGPHVPTLTLIDLPGLTKVPVGDQPADIEKQVRDMILTYISKPSCLILSVTAANTDIANSDGLKLAREVDPHGQRTLGVLTKLDLMDKGTDVVDILANRIIKLKLGFVPVINRSQHDIDTSKSIDAALRAEDTFFETHPKYNANAAFCGTRALTARLSKLLCMHIRNTLPDTRAKILSSLVKYREELSQLGEPIHDSPEGVLLEIVTQLSNEYRTVLDGNSDELSTAELSGGARIAFVLHELFANGIHAIDPFDQVKDADIRTISFNSSGSSPNLFVSTVAFEIVIKQQVKRFQEPSHRCIALIYEELVRILALILQQPVYKRYPQLKDALYNESILFLRNLVEPANKLVTDMVLMEASYVNTGHPDFVDGHTAMAIVHEKRQGTKSSHQKEQPKQLDLPQSKDGFFGSFFGQSKSSKKKAAAMEPLPPTLKPSGVLTDKDSEEIDVIKLLISSYFKIVKRTTVDMVPKAVMLYLVERSKLQLQNWLLKKFYGTERINELLKESDFVVERRKECAKMVNALEEALEIISGLQL